MRNPVLMQRIGELAPDVRVMTTDELGVPAGEKEAVAFALIGWATLHGLPGNVPSCTGASGARVLGSHHRRPRTSAPRRRADHYVAQADRAVDAGRFDVVTDVDLSRTVDRLVRLGAPGTHPAGAVAGLRTPAGTQVAATGWALRPGEAPGRPMTSDTLLDQASVTKVAVTTVLTMRQVAAGTVVLDDSIERYVGDVDPALGAVTLEQLLTHTGGLRPWWPLYCETTDRDEAIRRALTLPLDRAPGTARVYSDLGMVVLGHVLERVSGTGLDRLFHDEVTGPLGLRAGYGPVDLAAAAAGADSDAYELAMVETGTPYDVPFTRDSFTGWRAGPVVGEPNDGNAAHALGGVSGHAGLFAAVGDLLRLGEALLAGELVPPSVLARFAEPSAVDPSQALGFRRGVVTLDGQETTVLHHGGFIGTFLALAPDAGAVVAGGATRLHGVVGPLPPAGTPATLPSTVTGDEIQTVLLDALTAAVPTTSTTGAPR